MHSSQGDAGIAPQDMRADVKGLSSRFPDFMRLQGMAGQDAKTERPLLRYDDAVGVVAPFLEFESGAGGDLLQNDDVGTDILCPAKQRRWVRVLGIKVGRDNCQTGARCAFRGGSLGAGDEPAYRECQCARQGPDVCTKNKKPDYAGRPDGGIQPLPMGAEVEKPGKRGRRR